jgi:hypothetical protein
MRVSRVLINKELVNVYPRIVSELSDVRVDAIYRRCQPRVISVLYHQIFLSAIDRYDNSVSSIILTTKVHYEEMFPAIVH